MPWGKIDAPDLTARILVYIGIATGTECNKPKDLSVLFRKIAFLCILCKRVPEALRTQPVVEAVEMAIGNKATVRGTPRIDV